jgi:hypothetical protein
MAFLHGQLGPTDGIHVPFSWSYANAAARLAAVGFVAGDVGKLALQQDTSGLWELTGYSPIAWTAMAGAALVIGGTLGGGTPGLLLYVGAGPVLAQGPANIVLSGQITANAMALGLQSIATAGGTTVLTVASPNMTLFTGVLGQTLVLPAATSLTVGQQYCVVNQSTGVITVQTSGGAFLVTVPTNGYVYLTCLTIGTTAGTWAVEVLGQQQPLGVASTVTAGSTTTLTAASVQTQTFTGALAQIVVLPAANTLPFVGWSYWILNQSTGPLTVQTNGGATVATVATGGYLSITCTNVGSAPGTWQVEYFGQAEPRGTTTTALAGGTTTLTMASTRQQVFTGSGTTAQTVILPSATLLPFIDWAYEIVNTSSGTGSITVQTNGGAFLTSVPPGTSALLTCTNIGSAPGTWTVGFSGKVQAEGIQLIASAAGITTLTAGSPQTEIITGATTQTIVLPDATTIPFVGWFYEFANQSAGAVTIQTNGGATLWIMGPGTLLILTCLSTGSTAGTWGVLYQGTVSSTGKYQKFLDTLSFPANSAGGLYNDGSGNITYETNTQTINRLHVQTGDEQTVAMSGGTTTLTVASPGVTTFTGSGATAQTVVLPNATTLPFVGVQYTFGNVTSGTGSVTIQTNGGATLWVIRPSTKIIVTCIDTSTAAGVWVPAYISVVQPSGKSIVAADNLVLPANSAGGLYNDGSGNIAYETNTQTVNRLHVQTGDAQIVAMAGGTTTLTVASPGITTFTGSGATAQTVVLPDATTLPFVGVQYTFGNITSGTGAVTIQTNGGATLWVIQPSTKIVLTCIGIGTAAGTWVPAYFSVVQPAAKSIVAADSLVIPVNAAGYFNNDGAGTVTFVPPPPSRMMQVTTSQTTTASSWAQLLTSTWTTGPATAFLLIHMTVAFQMSGSGEGYFQLTLDGTDICVTGANCPAFGSGGAGNEYGPSMVVRVSVTANASHTLVLNWKQAGGITLTIDPTQSHAGTSLMHCNVVTQETST